MKSLSILTALLVACAASTGPQQVPRIVSVDAIACPIDSYSLNDCIRRGFAIDPAVNDSALHWTVLLPLIQHPPDSAYLVLTAWHDGYKVQELISEVSQPPDAQIAVYDTIVVRWMPPIRNEIEIELILAEGADPRFIEPVADTSFVWPAKGGGYPPPEESVWR